MSFLTNLASFFSKDDLSNRSGRGAMSGYGFVVIYILLVASGLIWIFIGLGLLTDVGF